jgi:type I restriction enzyme S subunit
MTLPKGWTTASLGDFTVERVEQGEPGVSAVPYIDIGSIDRGLKRVGSTEKVTRSNAPTRARQWVEPGDVLVSLTRPNLNAVALVTPELDGAVASTGFDVLRVRGVLPEWVFNRVRSQAFVSDVCKGVQGVVYPAIRPADVRSHELPIPPAQEQRRILEAVDSYLSRLDAAVANLERVQAKLEAYRASVLKAAVEGRLVPTEASSARSEMRDYEPAAVLLARILKERRRRWEEAEHARLIATGKTPKEDRWKAKYEEPVAPETRALPRVPEGWCWASVDQLTDGARRSGYGVLVPGPDVADGVPLVRVGDIRDGTVSTNNLKRIDREIADLFARTYLVGGEVLLSLVGTIGRSAVVPGNLSGANVARAVGVIPISRLVPSRWIEVWLRSPETQMAMNSRAHEVARKTLNLEDVRSAPVALPPLNEQDRIIAEVEDLESVAAALVLTAAMNTTRSVRLRQAVLKWAFEGKLVDQEPADEPADKLLARAGAERTAAGRTRKTPRRRLKGAA